MDKHEEWWPVSEGYAILRDALGADKTNTETWPRISPNEARAIRRDFEDGRKRLSCAPALLEAAQEALRQIEKYAEFFCDEDYDPTVDLLRAAITLATDPGKVGE